MQTSAVFVDLASLFVSTRGASTSAVSVGLVAVLNRIVTGW